MKRFSILTLLILSISYASAFQQDVELATIDSESLLSGEVLYAFNKNRSEDTPVTYDSLRAYLDQYINFKLKVLEARRLGYDSTITFQEELDGYLSQIQKPYLNNPKQQEGLLQETYDKLKWEVNASHILIKLTPKALAKDTLKAYTLLDSLRRTVKTQEQFASLAQQYSQDGSARNGGKLGWFTAFHMVLPFEEAAFNTPKGRVSEVTRSNFGYHIVYVNDKRPTRGKLKTSHIFFSNQVHGPQGAEQKARAIYDSLLAGKAWNGLVQKYSDDVRTKNLNGALPWMSLRQFPDEFYDMAYSIENIGEYKQPGKTDFGWHIVRLDDVEPPLPFELKRSELAAQLEKTGRNKLSQADLIKKLKRENGFTQDIELLNQSLSKLSKNEVERTSLADTELFRIGNSSTLYGEFLSDLPYFSNGTSIENIQGIYDKFEYDQIITYEDSMAKFKYPDYAYLLKEFEEGLLLFEVMQNKVWNKAIEDSLGLQNYFQTNRQKYQAWYRLKGDIVESEDLSTLERFMVWAEGSSEDLDQLAKDNLGSEGYAKLKIAKTTLRAEELSNFDPTQTAAGSWVQLNSNKYLRISEVVPPGLQELAEVRGLVLSDYQDELDRLWVEELRAKYKIRVNKKALKKIASE